MAKLRSTLASKFSLSPWLPDGSVKDIALASLAGWHFKFPSLLSPVTEKSDSQIAEGSLCIVFPAALIPWHLVSAGDAAESLGRKTELKDYSGH